MSTTEELLKAIAQLMNRVIDIMEEMSLAMDRTNEQLTLLVNMAKEINE